MIMNTIMQFVDITLSCAILLLCVWAVGWMYNQRRTSDVIVEAILFAWSDEEKALTYILPPVRETWDRNTDHNTMAEHMARYWGNNPYLIHSFSWRQENSQVVLPYMVLCESFKDTVSADPIHALVENATSTAKKSPTDIQIEQVISHAIRHLYLLAKEDRAVRGALSQELIDWLRGITNHPTSDRLTT